MDFKYRPVLFFLIVEKSFENCIVEKLKFFEEVYKIKLGNISFKSGDCFSEIQKFCKDFYVPQKKNFCGT